MTFSALVITYNEERCIHRLLSSIHNIVDRIVIIDTGSDDKTIEIANNFPKVEVYYKNWQDDFSDIRNFGLSFVQDQWCLTIDGDEYASFKNDFSNILDTLDQNVAYCLKIRNIDDVDVFNIPRLFFVKSTDRYIGRVHEYLDREVSKLSTTMSISLTHDGYTKENYIDKNKYDRNRMLLLMEEDKSSYRWNFYFNRYAESKAELDRTFQPFINLKFNFPHNIEVYCMNMIYFFIEYNIKRNKLSNAYYYAKRLHDKYKSLQTLYLYLTCIELSLSCVKHMTFSKILISNQYIKNLHSDECMHTSTTHSLCIKLADSIRENGL